MSENNKKNKFAIVSYNMYCNFTNYGSALQQYALHRIINELAPERLEAIVLNYCPDVLIDKDVLNPYKNMWDQDPVSKLMVDLSMPAIKTNYEKFKKFFKEQYNLSKQKYTSDNFNESLNEESLDGYVCGSDTIWCIQEFGGFDDGFFGNFPAMKESHTISYAASFGDASFKGDDVQTLKNRLNNFKAIGIRESTYLDFIKENVHEIPIQTVVDPTLLLTKDDYEAITASRQIDEPYVLLYARRYNKAMEEYTDRLAERMGWRVVEISLRATNSEKHIMKYDAGIEEFLSLVKNAEFVVSNSYHGAIFSIIMHKEFAVFSREQADTKIDELLGWLGLDDRKFVTGEESISEKIDFDVIDSIIGGKRAVALAYLRSALI